MGPVAQISFIWRTNWARSRDRSASRLSSKLLVVIATKEREKALTGLMYARNAIANEWFEDVKVVFFGPSERLIVQDEEVAARASDIASEGKATACKFLSDRDEISEAIEKLGVKVEYVGKSVSRLIKDGYIPMVW